MRETESLRTRVARVIHDHGQAKVARRTGVPQSSVSRYAKDRRIPAAFCSELVRHFGVNPAWLLAGEGEAYLTDITGATARTAGELLELVQAMERVSRLKLGSLAGRGHASVLRELNAQLQRYEHIRSKLNARTRPIFARIIKELEATLEEGRLDLGDHLARAAGQIARLCDDPQLHIELEQSRAYLAFERGHLDEALERQRQVFGRHIVGGLAETELDRQKEHNMVMTLARVGRYAEAYRVARALHALHSHRDDAFRALYVAAEGITQLEIPQDGANALRLMHEAWPHLGEWGVINRAVLTNAHEWMGVESLPACVDTLCATWSGRPDAARFIDAVTYVRIALSRDDHAATRRLLPLIEKPLVQSKQPFFVGLYLRAAGLADAHDGRARSAWRTYRVNTTVRSLAESNDPRIRFAAAVAACQLVRMISAREAWVHLEEAEAVLDSMPDDVAPPLRERWAHAQNIRALDTGRRRSRVAKSARLRADEWAHRLRACGFDVPKGV